MKIVAFLQNQWFKHPERHKRFAERYPELREEMIRRFLFAGCKTGRMLKHALGDGLCDEIVWEETSRNVGGHASSIFPADYKHMGDVIERHKPDIIVCFGKLACDAIFKVKKNFQVRLIVAPHPCARHTNVASGLKFVHDELIKSKVLETR